MITSKKGLRAVLPQLHNINVRKGHFDLTKIQQCIPSHCDGLDILCMCTCTGMCMYYGSYGSCHICIYMCAQQLTMR